MKLTREQTFKDAHKGFFSRDGKRLALMSRTSVDIIDIASERKLFHLEPGKVTLLGVGFSPDERSLAVAYRLDSAGQTPIKVSIWDAVAGREKLTLPVEDEDWRRIVDDLSFSSDGRLLASNIGGVARLWNVDSGKAERRFPPPEDLPGADAERVLLSPNGESLAVYFSSTGVRPNHAVMIWNLTAGQTRVLPVELYRDWRFSADSNSLAVTALLDKGKPTEHSAAEIWNVSSGTRARVIEVQREWRGAYTVAFSPDSNWLAVGGFEHFGLFSVARGELLISETHHRTGFFQDSELPSQLNRVEFSPDGKMLVTSGDDNTVKLWRLNP